MRTGAAIFLLLVTAATAAPAQIPPPPLGDVEDEDYWYDVLYPKLLYSSRDRLQVGGYFAMVQPKRANQYSAAPYRMSVALDAQAATSGSWFAKIEANIPGVSEAWRFTFRAVGRRWARDNYHGLGSATVFDGDLVTDAQPNFYRAERVTYHARGEVQRAIVGPIRLLVGIHAERWRVSPLSGPSVLGAELAAGAEPTIDRGTTDVAGRIGLVLDTRDDEVAPQRGVMLEAILSRADADALGDVTYTRATFGARGFLQPTARIGLAGRVVAQSLTGTPGIGSLYLVEAGDRFFDALGGSASHRGLRRNRFIGEDKLFANFELRYTLFAIPTLYELTIVNFLDAGRVFHQEEFRLTTDDLKIGGGTGLFFQIGIAGVVGVTVGVGPDGVTSNFHSRWSF